MINKTAKRLAAVVIASAFLGAAGLTACAPGQSAASPASASGPFREADNTVHQDGWSAHWHTVPGGSLKYALEKSCVYSPRPGTPEAKRWNHDGDYAADGARGSILTVHVVDLAKKWDSNWITVGPIPGHHAAHPVASQGFAAFPGQEAVFQVDFTHATGPAWMGVELMNPPKRDRAGRVVAFPGDAGVPLQDPCPAKNHMTG